MNPGGATNKEVSSADPPPNTPTELLARRRFLRFPSLRRLLIIVILTYSAVVVLVGIFQAKFIYFPARTIELTPGDVGILFEEVTLTTDDNQKISAWFVPCERARATVLFFHGNAGNNGDRIPEIKLLNSLGLNTLIVDYRGFGQSDGSPEEQGIYQDARAAWKYLVDARGTPPRKVVILGESLGGAVAIDLASRQEPAALVVQATFTRLEDVASIHYPLLPTRWLLRHRYNSIDKIGRVTCPKLFFHATDDSLIPMSIARALFDAAAQPKNFVETLGDHTGGGFMYSDESAKMFSDFVDSAVNSRPDG